MLKIETLTTAALVPYARNSRTHDKKQVAKIAASIREFGFTNPVLIDNEGVIIAGHGRVMAALLIGLESVPCVRLGHLSEAQKRAYVIADNQIALNSGWDLDLLRVELLDLKGLDFDIDLLGFNTGDLKRLTVEDLAPKENPVSLDDPFAIVPLSVLNAREGWWQNRKAAWLVLGIKSEAGRGEVGFAQEGLNKTMSGKKTDRLQLTKASSTDFYRLKKVKEKELGRTLSNDEFMPYYDEMEHGAYNTGTSIFDPVLCEIAYRWFSPPGGVVVDPFAGGSVRGVVAAKLGRQYYGVDLRGEQIAANRVQAESLCAVDAFKPVWIEGDSRLINQHCSGISADFIFTCPPYADLEVYSEDPQDLSTLNYSDFKAAYSLIIKKAVSLLKADRFACIVVGEVRGKDGSYYNFVGDTVQAFLDAGLDYYNEMILVTQAGSLPIRAGRQFSAGRKIGKSHQNVLVFVKGSGKAAAEACGVIEIDEACFAGSEEGVEETTNTSDQYGEIL